MQISAKKGTGVDDLLETVALVAEVEQLMSNPDRAAAGTVLEAHLDRRVGPIATLLVQTGTLHVGDVVVAGSAYGKVTSSAQAFHGSMHLAGVVGVCVCACVCVCVATAATHPACCMSCAASCPWCVVSTAVLAKHFCFARDLLAVRCFEHAAACVCKFALYLLMCIRGS